MKYPETITVEVSLEDLVRGTIGNGMACPIACALQRMGYRNFSVTEKTLSFANDVEYLTTRPAARFIQLYDAGYVPRLRVFHFALIRMPRMVAEAEAMLA